MKTVSVAAALALVLALPAFAQDEEVVQTLFTNVNVYDGVTPELMMNANVLVEGNLIAEVSTDPISAEGATVIDGGGRTLTPGLTDTHTHLHIVAPAVDMEQMPGQEAGIRGAAAAEDMLMRGFTTVRDLCGNTHGMRRAINDNVIPGPRIVSAGACIGGWSSHADFMTDTSVKGQTNMERIGMVRIADGPDEVRLAIREEMRKGASFIKIMIGGGLSSRYDPLDVTTMSKAEIEAAVDETARWGTYVTAHAYTDVSLNLGMDAGMVTFEHMHLAGRETFERLAEIGAVVSSQVGVVPTLCDNPLFNTPATKAKACNLQEGGIASFGYINDLNIRTGYGVDSFGSLEGYRYNSDAMIVRKEFFSNDKILEQMFANNAELIAMTGERNPYKDGPLAVIAPGAYADIILVEGDPTEDVAVFSDWENGIDLVMKDGVIYRNDL